MGRQPKAVRRGNRSGYKFFCPRCDDDIFTGTGWTFASCFCGWYADRPYAWGRTPGRYGLSYYDRVKDFVKNGDPDNDGELFCIVFYDGAGKRIEYSQRIPIVGEFVQFATHPLRHWDFARYVQGEVTEVLYDFDFDRYELKLKLGDRT